MKIGTTKTLHLYLTHVSQPAPRWFNDNTRVCELNVASDGLSAEVLAIEQGCANINVVSNCDFGGGWQEHRSAFHVEVEPEVTDIVVLSEPPPIPAYWTSKEE